MKKKPVRSMPVLEEVLSTGEIEQVDRPSIARRLAIQMCRQSELFKDRLGLGQLLAIELLAIKQFADAAQFNVELKKSPKYAASQLDRRRGSDRRPSGRL